jgi:predicted GIY-YIG superfamily endonuclease
MDPLANDYFYVLAFSDDVVKVGRTTDPRGRLNGHRSKASWSGVEVVDLWLSRDHDHCDVVSAERHLKAFCADRWPIARGTEWFAGADFDHVAAFAADLNDTLLILADRAFELTDHLSAA